MRTLPASVQNREWSKIGHLGVFRYSPLASALLVWERFNTTRSFFIFLSPSSELITFSSGLPREAPCYQDNAKNYCPHNTSYILQQLRKDTARLLFPPGSDALYGYVWRFIILIYFAESALLERGETQNDFNQGL